MKAFFLLTALNVICASPTQAAVNLREAGLVKVFRDPIFNIKRTYNSRSLYKGHFGLGWCTDWETKRIGKGRDAHLLLCDRKIPVGNDENPVSLPDGRKFYFDKTNLVNSIDSGQGEVQMIVRDHQSRIQRIVNKSGFYLSLVWNSNFDRITEIRDPSGQKLIYDYFADNLTEVASSHRIIFKYQYDDFSNLTRVDYADGTFEIAQFDSQRDWVLTFTHRNRCRDSFDYQLSHQNAIYRHVATAERRCAGQKIRSVKRNFESKSPRGGT